MNGLLTLKRCINRKHSKIDLCANAQSFPNNDIAATPVPTAHQILELIKSRASGFLSDFCSIANLISSPLIRSFCKVHWIEKLPQNPKILLQALSPKHQRWVGWLGVWSFFCWGCAVWSYLLICSALPTSALCLGTSTGLRSSSTWTKKRSSSAKPTGDQINISFKTLSKLLETELYAPPNISKAWEGWKNFWLFTISILQSSREL